jgi:hypothetical protein
MAHKKSSGGRNGKKSGKKPGKGLPKYMRKVAVAGPGKQRFALKNRTRARMAARALTTKALNDVTRSKMQMAELGETSESLHKGLLGMVTRVQPPQEVADKIAKMDPAKLADMYARNKAVFEVFYSYEGINYVPGYGYMVDDSKLEDFDLLIESYERLYGSIE